MTKAQHLAASDNGTGHFWRQRLTAILITPLTLWLAFSLAQLPGYSLSEFRAWVASPLTAVLLSGYILMGLYHGALGLHVILEDYVGNHRLVAGLCRMVDLLSLALAMISLYSILQLIKGY